MPKEGKSMDKKQKDIMLITNYWHFENERVSSRYRSFADILCQYYDLEVVTSTFCHLTKKQRDLLTLYLDALPYKMTLEYEKGYSKNISLQRISSYTQFGKNVYSYLLKRKKPDLILVSVPSLTVADLVTKYANENKIPVIVDVQDLWPEAFKMALPVPVLSDIAFLPMSHQANRIYRRANIIMAVSDTYVERAARENHSCDTLSIYIGTDSKLVQEKTQGVNIEKPADEFWVGYVGALGHSYDIKAVIDALAELQAGNCPNIVFKVMGDGILHKEFEDYALAKDVKCDFTGMLDYGVMMSTLRKCDLAVNPIIKSSVSSIINKVSDYAAAGVPVINTQDNDEYRELLNQYQAGINVESGNAHAMAQAILELYSHTDLINQMADQSTRLFKEKFDRQINYPKLVNAIERLT